jgi:hypothetical protein
MNSVEILTVLKKDLQMLTDSNDEYLKELLGFSRKLMEREGIIFTEELECQMIQVHYAAYLFRRRGGTETSMPRLLRYELNNLLFSQKGKI